MKYFKHLLYAIAWIWLLPVNLLALCWLLPMKIKGTFENIWWSWNTWTWNWDVANNSEFYKVSMKGWWGFVIGNNIVYVDFFPKSIPSIITHMEHEENHVFWNYILGVFFYPIYVMFSSFIYLFLPNKHAYLDNPLERLARKAAGQKVDISREEWTSGPNDRWPWN